MSFTSIGKSLRWIIWMALLLPACSPGSDEAYLFSYFTGNGEDGLHLAWSEDGMQWSEARPEGSFLIPEAGQDKLMRDPCIIRGGDGRFHMVWTVSWNEQGIGYASSSDLLQWSDQQYIPVMEHEPGALNCWAPELFYLEKEAQYMIYWATTIPGRFPETDSLGDREYNHRMYYCLTPDFLSFSETRILYDHGFNVIDATIQHCDEGYVMFLKNETRWPEPEKNIRMAWSDHPKGPWSEASEALTGEYWAEGPTATRWVKGGWMLYFDRYREHRMGALHSTDLQTWTDLTDSLRFPDGTNHGSVLKITRKELEQILNHRYD